MAHNKDAPARGSRVTRTRATECSNTMVSMLRHPSVTAAIPKLSMTNDLPNGMQRCSQKKTNTGGESENARSPRNWTGKSAGSRWRKSRLATPSEQTNATTQIAAAGAGLRGGRRHTSTTPAMKKTSVTREV